MEPDLVEFHFANETIKWKKDWFIFIITVVVSSLKTNFKFKDCKDIHAKFLNN